MPAIQITEVSTVKDTGSLYLVVSFWLTKAGKAAGNPPWLVNDFIFDLNANPNDDPTVKAANLTTIRQVIVGYIKDAVANKWSGDHTGDSNKPFLVNGQIQGKGDVYFSRVTADARGLIALAAASKSTLEVDA